METCRAIPTKTIDEYISKRKEIYNRLLCFIDNDDESSKEFEELTDLIANQKITKNRKEFKEFFNLIFKIYDNHYRKPDFKERIIKILMYYENEIKLIFSNYEIFHIFKVNIHILFSMIKNNVIIVDNYIVKYILQKFENKNIYFLMSEIESFVDSETKQKIEKELLMIDSNILKGYEEKYYKGVNDSYICELIREDRVEEFISYVNQANISLSSQIKQTIFETNDFLIDEFGSLKGITFIKYAAFYGSIQIFQYLKMNDVELTPSLWLYAIYGRNPEIIYILEENKVEPNEKYYYNYHTIKSFTDVYAQSIICHHNEIAAYIEEKYLNAKPSSVDFLCKYVMASYNYEYFPDNFNDFNNNGPIFSSLCEHNYCEFVEIFYTEKGLKNDKKIKLKAIYIYIFMII